MIAMSKKFSHTLMNMLGAALGAAALSWLVRQLVERFEEDTDEAIRQLNVRSHVIDTARGPIEVSIHGEGPPVLVVHGAAGGYDQGEVKSEEFAGVKYISVSRPGYLRTPLSTGATPAEQADALAALLDELKIPTAGFIGTSTGGLIGLFFALRHPERCAALVLVSSVNAPLPQRLSHYHHLSPLLKADFLPWALLNPETLLLVRPTLRRQLADNPEKLEMLGELIHTAYPTSLRLSGMQNDATQIDDLGPIPLEEISVPTLVIHGTADETVPFAQGVRSAEQIPGARFLPVYEGTHYCVLTHLELTRPAIMAFLGEHMGIGD
jgi:pimeloyl-ACP methyl ester carboxylesterase